MSQKLTDQDALRRNRDRTRARAGGGPALFLHAEARSEIEDRLSEVNKRFTNPAIVSGWPEAWRQTLPGAALVPDDEFLALEAGAHDLIIHAMGLHWSNDPVGQLIQCRRALRPDGLFLGVMFGGQTLSELRAALAEAEVALRSGLSARIAPMADLRDMGGLLQRAGFAMPVADTIAHNVSYAAPLDLMRDLRAMGENNALALRPRRFTSRAVIETAMQRYRDAYSDADGRVIATFELIFLAGWAPHASQPKPLRPGSARSSLADALGVKETAIKHDPPD